MKIDLVSLNKLGVDCCKKCGCGLVISESIELDTYSSTVQYREHINGGRYESRQFGCGQAVHYSPNMGVEWSTYSICTKDEEYRLTREKYKKARDILFKKIEELEVPVNVKKSLKDELEYKLK